MDPIIRLSSLMVTFDGAAVAVVVGIVQFYFKYTSSLQLIRRYGSSPGGFRCLSNPRKDHGVLITIL
uniref:7TM_GPCR_Srx domain-containing protein n=1 Tax=Angiostrongylus cantonensis TaxID=6313 RepID=A0A0K0D480_ANGCA